MISYYRKITAPEPNLKWLVISVAQPVYILYIAKMIKETVADKGWENLSGKTVKEQMEKTTDFDVLGLGKVSFTPDKHEPRKLKVYQVQGGKLIPITDFITCPD